MDSKLTLKLNRTVIERAKKYARQRNTSLSRMIENYLRTVTKEQEKEEDLELTPLVKSLIGVIKPPAKDYKKDYTDYLSHKYK